MPSLDERFMDLALREARRGLHRTWPNPWVGAVLVKAGRVIARGWHRAAGEPHAEALALRAAGTRARGATLYVSLEPCSHRGRQPPCTEAILAAGVRRVVAACPDPNPRAAGGLRLLKRRGVRVGPWVRRAEAEALNRHFLESQRLGRPCFTLKAASGLDGRTALSSGRSRWITSPASRADAKALRGRCDAVLVGAGTLAADDPGLLPLSRSAHIPLRLALDPRGRLGGGERIFRDRWASRSAWFAGPAASAAARRRAAARGAQVVRLRSRGLRPALAEALEWMRGRELRRVMVEGGAATLGACLEAGLADELVLYLAPRLEGSGLGRPLFAAERERSLAAWPRLDISDITRVGPDLRLSATFRRG